jgi:hypothetical protein
MSGKRAKPSPWRFLRLAPAALVAMVVCAMVGLFLLLSGSGEDQAHDWGLDPVPTDSQEHSATGPDSSPVDPAEPTASDQATPGDPTTTVHQSEASPEGEQLPETHAPSDQVTRASASVPAAQPAPRATRAPVPTPRAPVTGPAKDNPGKKKGLRKDHGPRDHPNR